MADNSEKFGGELPVPKNTDVTQSPSGNDDALLNIEPPPLSPAGDTTESSSVLQPPRLSPPMW